MNDRDATLKLWVVLSRAHAALSLHAEADVARHGLSLTEFAALEALYHKGPLLVGELQRKVLKSSGGMTYVVDRLQDKGLVRRRPCEEDRRAIYAELTAEGEGLLDRIFPLHVHSLQAASKGLAVAEKEEAIELLKRLGLGAEAGERGGPRQGTVEGRPRPDGGGRPDDGGRRGGGRGGSAAGRPVA